MNDPPESLSHEGNGMETLSRFVASSNFIGLHAEDANLIARITGDAPPTDAYGDEYSSSALRLINQEGVYQLTQDLRKFSDTLTSLKSVFCEERESLEPSLRVAAHERLGELLKVLKNTVNKYQELDSTGILNAAENLINHIKTFDYESVRENVSPEILSAINNLALAFSSSVSECLIGDINISPSHSLDIQNQGGFRGSDTEPVALAPQRSYVEDTSHEDLSPYNMEAGDGNLPSIDSTSSARSVAKSLEVTFDRAKTWSKYAGDLLNFIKKRSHIELEYANKLAKLSQTTRAVLSEQSFLPFQSLYCTLLDNDREYASNLSSMYQNHLLVQKFFDPLNAARQEHERTRKYLRESWRKEKRRVEEAEANVRKAKQNYNTRNSEYQKAKEAKLKADQQLSERTSGDGSHSRQGSGLSNQLAPTGNTLGTTKIDKKKKHEDDSYQKAMQAEKIYRNSVSEFDQRRQDLDRKEEEILNQLKECLTKSDAVTKRVTLHFFQAHCDLTSPIKIQYQALLDESRSYEPGSQYTEYLRHHLAPHQLDSVPDSRLDTNENYGFESIPGGSDTESCSSRSAEDPSPAPSPANHANRKANARRASTEGSLSSDEILDEGKDVVEPNRLKASSAKDIASPSFTESSSPVNARPQLKVMKMVEQVKGAFKGMKKIPKVTVFGVHFSVAAQDTGDGIPTLVKRCVVEIESRGVAIKGIYRVNGVKNRIEKICSLLDTAQCARADLSDHSPHDICGVLKYFFRQLPEPLVPFDFYDFFREVAKEYTELSKASRQLDEADDATRLEHQKSLQLCVERMKTNVEMLPAANNRTLHFIIAHLSRVSENNAENKMTASNLAIIFGPTLLKPKAGNESGQSLLNLLELPYQSQAIEMLISHHREIFLRPPNRVNSIDLKGRSQGPYVESVQTPDGDESPRIKSSPLTYRRSMEFLASDRVSMTSDLSPEFIASQQSPLVYDDTPTHSVGHPIAADANQDTSSRSSLASLTPSHELTSPRIDNRSEDNQRTELNNDGFDVTNDRRTIFSHRTSVTKNSSSNHSLKGTTANKFGSGGKRGRRASDLSDVSQAAKNSDTQTHGPRRPSLKNLPFFKSSQDSGHASESFQRSTSADTIDAGVSSHRPRSQRLLPATSARNWMRRQAQHVSPTESTPPQSGHEASDKTSKNGTISDKNDRCMSDSGHSGGLSTMPGRTPPMSKSVSLSLSKEQFTGIDGFGGKSNASTADARNKLHLDHGESTDDSFC